MADNRLKKHKEPFVRVTKRAEIHPVKGISIRAIAIVLAFIFCALVAFLVLDKSPSELYSAMIKGSFGTERKLWTLVKDIAVLLAISLAVTPAFKMRFWNTGAEGQVLAAALASAAGAFYLGGKVSTGLLILIMFAMSVAAGIIWAVIPAIFKALWNTNETLFTLMMNYIAAFLVDFFLIEWTKNTNGSSSLGELVHGHFPDFPLESLPKYARQYLPVILIVALLTLLMHIYLKYSKHGYEISVVGESEKTAKYIGINVRSVIIRTMAVSGAVCGLAGFLIVSGLDHTVTSATVGGLGFTAIMVSWLAKFKPINMIMTSFLLVFLTQGSKQVSQDFDISPSFPSVITGIILFFIIGCEFFIEYRLIFRKSKKEGKSK